MASWHTGFLAGREAQQLFRDIANQFHLSPDQLADITQDFINEMHAGLKEYKRPMAMIPSFVTSVPDGTETGTFLALDLGGTNLRVCAVQLHGDGTFSLHQQKYKISDALKTGEASTLFNYLADSVDAFLTSPQFLKSQESNEMSPSGGTVHLGFTFSFPVEQVALASGILLTWTKGFSAKNAVGKDVIKLLQDAFDRKHMHVKCVALVNDTVGTLLSHAYSKGGCVLGGVFGTGTNGAYVERTSQIPKLGKRAEVDGDMVINCEWGAFSGVPLTPYDKTLDRLSINPTLQIYEKSISGMYLGEITRLVLVSLIDAVPVVTSRADKKAKPILFGGRGSSVMNKMWELDSSVMSEIEEAWRAGNENELPPHGWLPFEEDQLNEAMRRRLAKVREVVVKRFGYQDEQVGLWDAAVVWWVSTLVARRAALLSGVAVAAILIQTGRAVLRGKGSPPKPQEALMVGVDGSLVEHYPGFQDTLRESLRSLVGAEVEGRVLIGMAKDGSGVGAALGALLAEKDSKR